MDQTLGPGRAFAKQMVLNLPVLLGRSPAGADIEAGKAEELQEDGKAFEGFSPRPLREGGEGNEEAWTPANVLHPSGSGDGHEKRVLALGAVLALCQGVSAPAIARFTADSIATMTVFDTANRDLLEAMTPSLVKIGVLALWFRFMMDALFQHVGGFRASMKAFARDVIAAGL